MFSGKLEAKHLNSRIALRPDSIVQLPLLLQTHLSNCMNDIHVRDTKRDGAHRLDIQMTAC